MWDDIIEIILELILDGAIEAASSKRVSMPIRILLAIIILVLLLGVCGLLIGIGISSGNTVLTIIGFGLLLAFTAITCNKLKKFRNEIKNEQRSNS